MFPNPLPSAIDELLSIASGDTTNEQLEVAHAYCKRQLALWDRGNANDSDIRPVAIGASVSDYDDQHSGATGSASGG